MGRLEKSRLKLKKELENRRGPFQMYVFFVSVLGGGLFEEDGWKRICGIQQYHVRHMRCVCVGGGLWLECLAVCQVSSE